MRVLFCALLCVVLLWGCEAHSTQLVNNYYTMTVPELITTAGYPNEHHRVETEDGYILQLHRIPAGRRIARHAGRYSTKRKQAILLVHGLMGGSGDFVIMGPGRSLGYLLADAGYDVWLGNLRGTIYSSHKNYTKESIEFWNFSFHEHGKYDAPAMIDTILNVTGLSKIMYIGYSMGTTTFFTMMSQRPEYNDKLITFIALAPAVYLDNIRPLTTLLFRDLHITDEMRAAGVTSLGFQSNMMNELVDSACNLDHLNLYFCMSLIFTVVGEDYEQCDWDMLPIILRRLQPASWRQFEHFGKNSMTGVFTSWEGGLWHNVRPYNLSNVRVPVTLLYGENDQLTEKSQIMRLAWELHSIGVLEDVSAATSWPKFNHLDFTYARDIGVLLNEPLVRRITHLFNKYST